MTPQATLGRTLTSIGQIAISVKELARATAFYRDILGLKFLFEAANMAFFDCDGTRLMLNRAEQPEAKYSSIIYYKTDDIRKTTELLLSRGVAFESEPRMIARMPDHELWMAFFRDSEGNLAGLMSEVR
jgi:methylmalonyl-CoA/ethylmalonyl-CoA epimerase